MLGTVLHPMMGYPFALDVSLDYQVSESGLRATTTARNVDDRSCPYASGQLPYLFAGTGVVDPCTLQLGAGRWLPTDDRDLPTGAEPVAGSPYDFDRARRIGGMEINCTFTDLVCDDHGLAWVRLTAPTGRRAEIWLDENYPYVEMRRLQPDESATATWGLRA